MPPTREPVDLFAVLAADALLVLVVLALPDASWLRVALGLPFVLFLPGYALVAALFPAARREGVEGGLSPLERVALSFGLSIAVVPLLGLLLNATPWGIRLVPVLLTVGAFTLLLSFVALARRQRLPPLARPAFALRSPLPPWGGLSRLDKGLTVAAVVALVVAGGAVAYVVAVPRPGEAFAEFYVLGPGGKAEGYPTTLAANETGTVLVGIVNHERAEVAYEVRPALVRDGNRTPLDGYEVRLPDGGKDERPWTFRLPDGGAWKVELGLYRTGDATPYRSLHLWVNTPPEARTT